MLLKQDVFVRIPLSVPDQVREGCYERERERLLNDRRSVERSLDQEKRLHREQNVRLLVLNMDRERLETAFAAWLLLQDQVRA